MPELSGSHKEIAIMERLIRKQGYSTGNDYGDAA